MGIQKTKEHSWQSTTLDVNLEMSKTGYCFRDGRGQGRALGIIELLVDDTGSMALFASFHEEGWLELLRGNMDGVFFRYSRAMLPMVVHRHVYIVDFPSENWKLGV